jgi:hypothetical protein
MKTRVSVAVGFTSLTLDTVQSLPRTSFLLFTTCFLSIIIRSTIKNILQALCHDL